MEYRAVGNRCAVEFGALNLPLSLDEALLALTGQGFKALEVDVVELARQCIGVSIYRRGARPWQAPGVVDCSSFIKWLYGQRGIWLPRRSIQQRELGQGVDLGNLVSGDVVFTSGWINYYHTSPEDGVGHVGIATGKGTVVHAANKKVNVVESSLAEFVGKNKFRGARRYLPQGRKVLTLQTPPSRGVEIADDIRWIVLQSISR